MIESVEHIKPILALNTLVMVLFTMAICFTKVGYKHTLQNPNLLSSPGPNP